MDKNFLDLIDVALPNGVCVELNYSVCNSFRHLRRSVEETMRITPTQEDLMLNGAKKEIIGIFKRKN